MNSSVRVNVCRAPFDSDTCLAACLADWTAVQLRSRPLDGPLAGPVSVAMLGVYSLPVAPEACALPSRPQGELARVRPWHPRGSQEHQAS